MKEVSIISDDKIGLLADISYLLGKSNINIESVSATSVGGKAVISVLVKNREKTKDVLQKNGFKVSEHDTFFINVKDKPGQLAEISKMFSDAEINLDNVHLVSKDGKNVIYGLTVNKGYERAREIVKYYLLDKEQP